MDRRTCFLLPLMCCLALLTAACSFSHLGKANKDAKSAAGQSGAGNGIEAAGAGEVGNEGRERKWANYGFDRGVNYYYEKETLSYPSKGFVRAWRRRVFPPRSAQKEIIELDEIDCKEATYSSLTITVVSWDDSAKTFNRVSPWTRIFPGSPDETLYVDVCRASGNSP